MSGAAAGAGTGNWSLGFQVLAPGFSFLSCLCFIFCPLVCGELDTSFSRLLILLALWERTKKAEQGKGRKKGKRRLEPFEQPIFRFTKARKKEKEGEPWRATTVSGGVLHNNKERYGRKPPPKSARLAPQSRDPFFLGGGERGFFRRLVY